MKTIAPRQAKEYAQKLKVFRSVCDTIEFVQKPQLFKMHSLEKKKNFARNLEGIEHCNNNKKKKFKQILFRK